MVVLVRIPKPLPGRKIPRPESASARRHDGLMRLRFAGKVLPITVTHGAGGSGTAPRADVVKLFRFRGLEARRALLRRFRLGVIKNQPLQINANR